MSDAKKDGRTYTVRDKAIGQGVRTQVPCRHHRSRRGGHPQPVHGAGALHLRPRLRLHGQLREQDHLHRRRRGHPDVPRLSRSSSSPRRAPSSKCAWLLLLRRAADAAPARGVRPHDPHPHDAERDDPASLQRLSPRRPPDGHGGRRGGVHVGVLPRHHRHPESASPGHLRPPHHRQAAHDRGGGLQALARPAVHLPAQRPGLLLEPAAHVLRRARRALPRRSRGGRGAGPALHPARGPRAELQHLDGAHGRQLRHQSLLGHLRRHLRALGPGPRRRQRGRAEHARGDRHRRPTSRSSSPRPRTRTTPSA